MRSTSWRWRWLPVVVTWRRCPSTAGTGPNPTLPPPNPTLIPTVKIAPAVGWQDGAKPEPSAGLAVNAFATGLDHPRWLYVLPNGDVLVAESNAPPRPEGSKGIRAWFMKRAMKRAGAGVPSANRIMLLRDADGDGVAEIRTCLPRGFELTVRHGAGWAGPPCGQHRRNRALSVSRRNHADHGAGGARRPASGRGSQPPLDEERDRERRRRAPVRDGGLQQQRGGARHGGGAESRRHPRGRPGDRHYAGVRHGASQPERSCVGASHAARYGRWSTNATRSAATWCPTT